MLKFIVLGILLVYISPAGSLAGGYEISETGRDTVYVTDGMTEPGGGSFATDIVPYPLNPDWSLDLRMQVGGIAVADLDGDRDMDVVVGCYHSQSYPPYNDWRNFILFNVNRQLQSSPGWWSLDTSSTTDVKIADIDDEGHLDIFCANGDFTFDPDCIYFGHEGDTISHAPGWTSANQTWTTGAAIGDFDSDNDLDVATSNQGVSPDPYRPVHIYINNNGNLERTPSWSSAAREISSSVEWGDCNNDGWLDLAVSKWVNFNSCIYFNNSGSIATSPGWTGNTTQGQKGITWGDVNNDNYPELAIGGSIPTQIYSNNNGMPASNPFWESQNSYHGTQDIAWADVDNDGDLDLATVEFSTGHLRIYLNRNGQFNQTPSWQYDSPSVGTALAFGDINGDGLVDLIMGVSGQPCIMVFYNSLTSLYDNPLPTHQELYCYPNPFNSSISVYCPIARENPNRNRLIIVDIGGRCIRELTNPELVGDKSIFNWDGCDQRGEPMPSGIYFAIFADLKYKTVAKLTLLK